MKPRLPVHWQELLGNQVLAREEKIKYLIRCLFNIYFSIELRTVLEQRGRLRAWGVTLPLWNGSSFLEGREQAGGRMSPMYNKFAVAACLVPAATGNSDLQGGGCSESQSLLICALIATVLALIATVLAWRHAVSPRPWRLSSLFPGNRPATTGSTSSQPPSAPPPPHTPTWWSPKRINTSQLHHPPHHLPSPCSEAEDEADTAASASKGGQHPRGCSACTKTLLHQCISMRKECQILEALPQHTMRAMCSPPISTEAY
eukprot:354713-Pelagomonas_calceolata.AAC.1